MTVLQNELDRLLRRLDRPQAQPIESGNAEFVGAIVALEKRLRDLQDNPPPVPGGDALETLIQGTPLSYGDRSWLHDLRRMRNSLVHNHDVYVGKTFTRASLHRLRQIALVLEGAEIVAETLMVGDVVTVAPGEPVSAVQEIMETNAFSQVPICEPDGRLVGVVTERSLLQLLAQGWEVKDLGQLPATEALTGDSPVRLRSNATFDEIVRRLRDPATQYLCVVDGERLVGLITRADLVELPSECRPQHPHCGPQAVSSSRRSLGQIGGRGPTTRGIGDGSGESHVP